jgi:flagellin-like hook-associated protein FlgL
VLNTSTNGGTYIDGAGASLSYTTFSRTLQTHDSGLTADGSVSINVINFDFMLSIGGLAGVTGTSNFSLGAISLGTGGSEHVTNNFINDITVVSVGSFIDVINRIADMRAENGAEQNRVMQRIDLLQSNLTNVEAAHGRIMDADIALESTRFARHNILVQASASMTAQANQLSTVALSLIG